MRTLSALFMVFVTMVACALPACGQVPQQDSPKKVQAKEEPKLKIGDPAPAWVVTTWLNGNEVKREKDKVYLIEFWATWCTPCIAAMPHLAELQADHKAEGLVVIGMTHKDEIGNDQASVTQFVKERGAKLGYVFAYCDTSETYAAYMDASGQRGIPCSFVIDQEGKIAYIGHPATLDTVLPKVLAGKWKGKDDAQAVTKMNDSVEQIVEIMEKDPQTALASLRELIQTYPDAAKTVRVRGVHLGILMAAKKFYEAKTVAADLLAEAEKKQRVTPAVYALSLGNRNVNPEKKNIDVAVQAADLVVKLADDYRHLLGATDVYAVAGLKDKATAAGRKTVEAAPTERAKRDVGKVVDKILSEIK